MPKAIFRFYEELNDFLPEHRQKIDFKADFTDKRSIKDMIEALGVPHTEIDLILANGKSVDFTYILQDEDRVSVYPVFESLNIENVTRLRKIPLRRTKFIADINLGDIVKFMRVLGFDVYFDPTVSIQKIIEISQKESRIILTKSKKLLKFKKVTHGIFIRPGTTEKQIKRILDYLDITDRIRPFSRCLLCNNLLESVPKEKIIDRIPPKTRHFCDEYTHCKFCGKIFWKGAHFIRMKKVIEQILNQPEFYQAV
ncbi:MAG: Mut7-C ubiquitin/RNAse domain-containing protein [Deltaproteobacteria bacterium]|nr:Mut7-C ubiquitin/RNAse domain-containing protein [Deltaproteobacteria bacterium]